MPTQSENAPGAIRMLKTQHRMHPAIGELISEVFYDGALTHGISESDRLTLPSMGEATGALDINQRLVKPS